MKNLVSRFVKDESGATAIEYGLIAAGIAIAIITAVKGVGTKLSAQLQHDLDLAEVSDRRNLLQRPRSCRGLCRLLQGFAPQARRRLPTYASALPISAAIGRAVFRLFISRWLGSADASIPCLNPSAGRVNP